MDGFSWILIIALLACVAMHLFGHGHGHGGGHGGERKGERLSRREKETHGASH